MKRLKNIDATLPWWRDNKALHYYSFNNADAEIYHDVYADEDYFVLRLWNGSAVSEWLLSFEEFAEFKLTGSVEGLHEEA